MLHVENKCSFIQLHNAPCGYKFTKSIRNPVVNLLYFVTLVFVCVMLVFVMYVDV